MSATGHVPARARRHPITVVMRARELVNCGYGAEDIVRMFADNGVTVGISSIRRWTDARVQREDRRRDRERAARRARFHGGQPMGPQHARADFKLGRMVALREVAGLKDAQIARVMAFDFGDVMSRDAVADAVTNGAYPRHLR